MFKGMKPFLSDESGQTTTEYILILALVVFIAMKMRGMLGGKLQQILQNVLSQVNSAASMQ